MDIKEALTWDGLKRFYTTYIKPIRVRISQLGSAANCTVVNNSTTTSGNTVLDGRMGKTLGDRLTTVEGRVENHAIRTGASCYTGYYNYDWNLSTTYKDIGNTRSFDDKYFAASSGLSAIQVREGGLYMLHVRMSIYASGYDKVWIKIVNKNTGSDIGKSVTVVNGQTTVEAFTIVTLTKSTVVEAEAAKETGSVDIKVDKNESYLQIVKLT